MRPGSVPRDAPKPDDSARRRFAAWLAAPVLVGTGLRVLAYRSSVFGDDELHAVRAALSQPLRQVLTYQVPDHSMPLSVLYKLMMRLGPVSEATLRFPMLAGGLLLTMLLPWAVRRHLGARAAVWLTWLVACSPVLVLYGSVARPYMVIVPLGTGAVLALYRWMETGSRRMATAYVLMGALASYFHPVATPLLFAALAFAAVTALAVPGAGQPRLRSVMWVGAGLLLAITLFLIPARGSLTLMTTLRSQYRATSVTMTEAALMQAGTRSPMLAMLFFACAAWGLVRLLRRTPRFGAYTATLVLAQLVGLLVQAPAHYEQPLVFNRYLMMTLPLLLMWVAMGLAEPPLVRTAFGGRLSGVIAVVFFLALLASGPFARRQTWRTSFLHHNDYLLFYRRRGGIDASEIPRLYHSLRDDPRAGAVIEFPWHTTWPWARIFARYQEFHGRDVIVMPYEKGLYDPRLAFRNMLPADATALLASRAQFLIVHLDVAAEEDLLLRRRVRGGVAEPLTTRARRQAKREEAEFHRIFAVPPTVRAEMRDAAAELVSRFTSLWGPPAYVDEKIVAWDLEALRSTRREAASRARPAG